MKHRIFYVVLSLFGYHFVTFLDLDFASVVKGGMDPNKVRKDRKNLKHECQKINTSQNSSELFVVFFLLDFGGVSESVFFCALVAEVSQIGATSGHFSSYVAAKLGR